VTYASFVFFSLLTVLRAQALAVPTEASTSMQREEEEHHPSLRDIFGEQGTADAAAPPSKTEEDVLAASQPTLPEPLAVTPPAAPPDTGAPEAAAVVPDMATQLDATADAAEPPPEAPTSTQEIQEPPYFTEADVPDFVRNHTFAQPLPSDLGTQPEDTTLTSGEGQPSFGEITNETTKAPTGGAPMTRSPGAPFMPLPTVPEEPASTTLPPHSEFPAGSEPTALRSRSPAVAGPSAFLSPAGSASPVASPAVRAHARVVTGSELHKLSENELAALFDRYEELIFARVSPTDKLVTVRARAYQLNLPSI